jgi:hypothetical protein
MRQMLIGLVVGCSAHHTGTVDAPAVDDLRCQTEAPFLTTHPHSPAQASTDGARLVDTRGWYGRLYFAYGDVAQNTGPIWVSSLDPVANVWVDHFLFQTQNIFRFDPIGDMLYAPAGQAMGDPPSDYAVGTASHDWGPGGIHIGTALHLVEAVERAPGDVYLTGEDWFDEAAGITTSAVYRSQNGGPFTEIFPDGPGNNQLNSWFFNAAALNGTLYPGFGWTFDGQSWAHPAVDTGQFQRPTTFANRIVSATLGELWAFDGTHMSNLHVDLFPTPCLELTTLAPLPMFEESEDHLLVVDDQDRVMVTTDLETWTCVGHAPPDACSIGSLDGTIYFGGPAGRIYAFPSPSW